MSLITAWALWGVAAPMTVFLVVIRVFPPKIHHYRWYVPAPPPPRWTAERVREPAEVPARKQLER